MIKIRPIQASDKDDWCRLWTAYLAFYGRKVAEEVFDVSFARLLSNKGGEFRGFIAEQDGKTVGLVHFLFHRHMWSVENCCYLQDLYTDPSARGAGVGRALIEAVYEAADQAGAPAVYWLTQEFNYQGRMLYDRVGVKTPFIRYNRS